MKQKPKHTLHGSAFLVSHNSWVYLLLPDGHFDLWQPVLALLHGRGKQCRQTIVTRRLGISWNAPWGRCAHSVVTSRVRPQSRFFVSCGNGMERRWMIWVNSLILAQCPAHLVYIKCAVWALTSLRRSLSISWRLKGRLRIPDLIPSVCAVCICMAVNILHYIR